jgi:large conductance mechanosensitive channel
LGQSEEARKERTMLKEMVNDFKTFIMRGNVTDMAVGIIIGAAFGTIVGSMVKDVVMPPIGLVLGKIDFSNLAIVLKQGTPPSPYATIAAAQAAGAVTLNYGLFINTIINFLIIALVVFFFIVRPIAKMRAPKKAVEPAAPTTRECSFCYSNIPIKATRCPNCTSELEPA